MQYWVKQMKEKGHLNAGKSSGRKPKHTEREFRQLLTTVRQNPELSEFGASRKTASKILKLHE
jgi:hypothetical protein